ncbi:MAG: hypothetical protein FWE25_08845 [Lachnospiraceae bacterium]|nr:hypothetical protein [Lachnospiraceae bacterium]
MEFASSFAGTIWSLIPILVTILAVFLTKRILLSMTVGIIAAALMAVDFNVFNTILLLEQTVTGIFFSESETALFGSLNRWYFSVLIFLFGLGIASSFVVITGGAKAFIRSIAKRVKTRKGVQFIIIIIGVVLMIDDYFNAMINGNIAKTLSKDHKLSRARSTYIVDSIAAPICIAAPISSWAVAIMGNMGTVYQNLGQERNIFMDFLAMIPFHFYVFAAISMVIITALFDFNMFSMEKYEKAIEEGEDISVDLTGEGLLGEAQSSKGTIWDFWLPIIVLAAVTLGMMFITGLQSATPEQIAESGLLYSILDNVSLSMSLLMGGIAAIVASFAVGARHIKLGEITKKQFWRAAYAGLASMSTAAMILILSWIISTLISRLQVGEFVASILYGAGIYGGFIPFIMFVSAALLAFSIGTSWGTFAVVLPIAGAVVYTTGNMHLLLPAMSAVLSGAVWGDHSSPISDTTILSSAGASCKVFAHFESQLPYAILAAVFAGVGYLFFGLSSNLLVGYFGFVFVIVGFGFFVWATRKRRWKSKHST